MTIGLRREKLEEMARGNGLSDAYTATLARLEGQKGNKAAVGLKVLKWVLYSERPLRAEELCHALAVEMGSQDLNPKNIPVLRTLLSSCLGLATVEASSSTIRLVHFTLQEHLLSSPTLFPSPHSTIAGVCLTYLNFGCIRDLQPDDFPEPPPTMSLLEYASFYWGKHARMGMTKGVKILALKLLDRFDDHLSAQLLFRHYYDQRPSEQYRRTFPLGQYRFSALHAVSFFGIVEIVATLLEGKGCDVNATARAQGSALTWAAREGHEEVVKMLLEQEGVNPDQADKGHCQTPLSWAAMNGHGGVVKSLLEQKEVNPDRADKDGRTPISWAAGSGHDGVVKILLEQVEVNPGQPDTVYGRRLLSWAAEGGHGGAVKLLLERVEVNPDHADRYGQTPISSAASRGHEGVVKMLLEREEVNPDQPDIYGGTPLSRAAEMGHEGVVEMLLERVEVNPDRPDTMYSRTPISHAAMRGHARIVKLLLEQKEVNPDRADKEGRTPISWAAERGHEGIVKVLLEQEEVNPDRPDTMYSRTPIWWAAARRHEGIVKMLLEREDVDPNRADTKFGETPILWAAARGHEGVVKILLERKANTDQADTDYGRTLLSLATQRRNSGLIFPDEWV